MKQKVCSHFLAGCCMLLTFFVLASQVLWSQETRAAFTGTITDPQGAVLPGAKVEAKNVQTNVTSSTAASSTGFYTLPLLNPGIYEVTVSASGFKTSVQSNVTLRVGDRLELNFKLELGSISETIEVTGEAPLLQTATASQGTVITQDDISSLPILDGNVYELMKLTVGATKGGMWTGDTAMPWFAQGSNYYINGSNQFGSEFLLDGSPNTNREMQGTQDMHHISNTPPSDAVGEFKMWTNSYDAEFGRTGGGVLNVSMKSGTNKFHGSLYEIFRNDVLNANYAENNAAGIARAPLRWNQPGGSITGPVIKDKLFFMFSFEAIRQHVPDVQNLVVPTALERQGDFSQTLGPNGQPIQIYDPLSTTQDASGNWVRTAFAGSKIPANRLDPVAVNLMKFMPTPNISGRPRGAPNLVVSPNMKINTYNTYASRVDYSLSGKNNLHLTFNHDDYIQTGGTQAYNLAAASTASQSKRSTNAVTVNFTSVVSTKLISDSRINFSRHVYQTVPYAYGYDPSSLGFPSSLVSKLPVKSFPTISLSGYASLGVGGGAGGGPGGPPPPGGGGGAGGGGLTSAIGSTWTAGQTFSTVIRAHSLKYGLEFREMLDNYSSPSSSFGGFSFSAGFTQANYLNADPFSGDSVASFLLGYASSGSLPINPDLAYASRYWGLFVQDDWRVSNKLTLNLGLRWDYETPETERYNRIVAGFDPSTGYTLPNSNVAVKGGLMYADSVNRYGHKPDKNNIQPRFGFAYKITDKLVLRGGFGIMSEPQNLFPPATGYKATTSMVTTQNNNLTPYNVLSNPYPNGLSLPTGNSLGLATYLGQSVGFIDPDHAVSTSQSFSLGLQYELPFNMVLDLSYVGARSSNQVLQGDYTLNNIPAAQWIALGNSAGDFVPNPYQGLLPGTSLNGPMIPRYQLLEPYPQFAGVNRSGSTNGKRWYDAMQVQFQKRLSKGLMTTFNYTFSKTLGQAVYLNSGHISGPGDLSKAITPMHIPHSTNIAASYALPFGANTAGVARQLLYGWNLSTTISFQSAAPWFLMGMDWTGGPIKLSNPTMARYFNTCNIALDGTRQACASPSEPAAWRILGTYGAQSIRHNAMFLLAGPSMAPFKAGISSAFFKQFKITEGSRLEFRSEFFNLLNSPAFGNVNTMPFMPTFGQVTFSQSNQPRVGQLTLKYTF
jgi:hypothetical protein